MIPLNEPTTCEDCLRRTTPPIDHPHVAQMTPPSVIVFFCAERIEP